MPVRKLLLTPPAIYLAFSAISAAERSNDNDMKSPALFVMRSFRASWVQREPSAARSGETIRQEPHEERIGNTIERGDAAGARRKGDAGLFRQACIPRDQEATLCHGRARSRLAFADTDLVNACRDDAIAGFGHAGKVAWVQREM